MKRFAALGAVASIAIAVVVTITGWSVPTNAVAQTSPPTYTVKLLSKEDAFVSSGQPGSNFGSKTPLYVGEKSGYAATRTLVYFDFKQLKVNEVVTDGQLQLYLREAGPSGDPSRDIVLYRVTSGWQEGSVTWNNFPGYNGDRLASTGIGTGQAWYSWGVKDLVRNWYRQKWDNQGIYVQGYETAGSYRGFDSREGANDPVLKLTVFEDIVPATATLNPLPPYANVADILLTWAEGNDGDGSGIDYYQIWYQRGSDQWLMAADQLRTLSYVFKGAQNGYRYGFRVLAIDRAGNIPPAAPAQTQTLVDMSGPVVQLSQLPAWVNGPFTLTWSGYDLPNTAGLQNSGIQQYNVDYNINNTAWGPLAQGLTTTSTQFTPSNGVAYQFRVVAMDRAQNYGPYSDPIAQTRADLQAPVAWFLGASGVDSPVFRVSWTGDDVGGSGIVNYDVQYRLAQGGWTNWVNGTQETFKDFTGQYGQYYYFRVRATDLAGNRGNLPSDPQLTVLVIRSSELKYQRYLPKVDQVWTHP
jgi:hypothetical protein